MVSFSAFRLIITTLAIFIMADEAKAANVTPDVIFGSGNANGSFTVSESGGVELGLRGKLRYNSAGLPENVFNYDGVKTYIFDPALSNPPANRSLWNFEWSINSDVDGNSGFNLDALTYMLSIDFDPTAANNGIFFDPINLLFADHAIGDNWTGNGAGTEAANAGDYATLIANNNVAQNSWNLGFFLPNPLLSQLSGIYTIALEAFFGRDAIASTSIDIIVAPVPLPAAFPLFGFGLAILGFFGWRRKRLAAA